MAKGSNVLALLAACVPRAGRFYVFNDTAVDQTRMDPIFPFRRLTLLCFPAMPAFAAQLNPLICRLHLHQRSVIPNGYCLLSPDLDC